MVVDERVTYRVPRDIVTTNHGVRCLRNGGKEIADSPLSLSLSLCVGSCQYCDGGVCVHSLKR